MKKGKWFYEAQRLFKQWKADNDLTGDCIVQTITHSSLEEKWFVYGKTIRGTPIEYTLHAYKNTGEVYLLPKYGDPIRIYLKKQTLN